MFELSLRASSGMDMHEIKAVASELRGMFTNANESGHPVISSTIGELKLFMRENGIKRMARRVSVGLMVITDWDAWKSN